MTFHRALFCMLLIGVCLALATSGSFVPAQVAAQQPAAEQPTATQQPAKAADEPIDFMRARALLQKKRSGGTLTDDEEAYLARAIAARTAGQRPAGVMPPRDKTGMKPLTEMTAEDRHQGQDGGLYGEGRNTPPKEHQAAAEAALAKIQPLDAQGKPSVDGKIVLVSISMSNATQEFSTFKRIADADTAKSPRLTIVDCAQGGQAMAEWVPADGRPWSEALRRIQAAGVAPEQVQVAWIKLANKGPSGSLEQHGGKLKQDTLKVIQNAKARFPNLKIAYLSSRIYGGYANGNLNPEPYAYESAFPVRWLIQDQIGGNADLNYNADRGEVRAPLLLWGPYLWADGVTPRKSDSLVYERADLAGDGVHPSNSGREKVARQLLDFFSKDPLAKSWFTGK